MPPDKETKATPGFRELLNKCPLSDFDGHTEFYRMTAEERLDALAALVRFVQQNKGAVNRKKSR